MTDLHVVSSISTAGSLRAAIDQQQLEGEVFCTMDAPELGPLGNGEQRMEFWKNLGYNNQEENEPPEGYHEDIFEPWQLLRRRLMQSPVNRLVLWIGGSGSDYVFLRMACHWLEGINVQIEQVQVPPYSGHFATAVNPPGVLAPMIANAVKLSRVEREQLAQEYNRIVARPELLRECDENGQLVFMDLSAHDDLLMLSCTSDWQIAARVVGEAMARSDPRNSLGDAFLSARLEYLIDKGYIVSDKPRTSLRSFSVRRVI